MPNLLELDERPREPDFKIFTGALNAGIEGGRKVISCTASSSVVDLHGDEITAECVASMAEQALAKGMTIFLNHSYQIPEDTFGKTVWSQSKTAADGVAELDLQIEVDETNPRATQTYNSIVGDPTKGRKGLRLGVSIGAQITDWEYRDAQKEWAGGIRIKGVDLLEASIVGIPANQRSWVHNAVKSLRKSAALENDPVANSLTEDEDDDLDDDLTEKGQEAVVGEDGEEIVLTADQILERLGPEAVKAPLSSESRGNLPDSAFACPAKRKYPHHTSSGAVDKSHLRNALSRCGDASNDQCGCSHIRAHAKKLGIGDGDKSFEELLVLSLTDDVSEDHFDNTEVEEGPTYDYDAAEADGEAEKTAGENTAAVTNDPVTSAPSGDSRGDADGVVADQTVQDIVASAAEVAISDADRPVLTAVLATLEQVAFELRATKSVLTSVQAERDALVAERDKAVSDLSDAQSIIEAIAKLPLGRKARFVEPIQSFRQRFAGIYPEDYLRLIDERNT